MSASQHPIPPLEIAILRCRDAVQCLGQTQAQRYIDATGRLVRRQADGTETIIDTHPAPFKVSPRRKARA